LRKLGNDSPATVIEVAVHFQSRGKVIKSAAQVRHQYWGLEEAPLLGVCKMETPAPVMALVVAVLQSKRRGHQPVALAHRALLLWRSFINESFDFAA
jgi:hypothetical protein